MKKLLFLSSMLLCLTGHSQFHDYDNEGTIFSYSTNKVSIGDSNLQGSYSNPNNSTSVLEVSSTTASFFRLGGSNTELFLYASDIYGYSLLTGGEFPFKINNTIYVNTDNSVSIGTQANPADYKLAVGGKIIAEAVRVELEINWPDYVFYDEYSLLSIKKLESFIAKYGHLPNIPSAEKIKEEGIDLGDMQAKQMEKIEELTLYIIQLKNELDVLKEQVSLLTNKQ